VAPTINSYSKIKKRMGDPFVTPLVYVNPTGFGPTTLPERFVNLPFVTFTKWERLGRASNFGGFQLGQGNQNRYQTQMTNNRFNDDRKYLFGQGGANPSLVQAPQQDDDFELVDTTSKEVGKQRQGPRFTVKRGQGGPGGRGNRGGRGRGGFQQRDGSGARGEPMQDLNQPMLKGKQAKFLLQGARRGKQWNKRGGMGRRRDFGDRDMMKEASVKVKPNWEMIEQLDFPQLNKMTIGAIPQAQDILSCGELHKFDESFDKITLKSTKPLKMTPDTSFVFAGTLEDPVIEKLIEEKKGTVFTTDEILSYLMTASRSVKTWDLIFTRVGDVLFIDKRDDAQMEILTVSETFTDRISDKDETRLKMPYNAPDKIGLEATAINQSFLLQVIKKDDFAPQANPNPFSPEEGSGEAPRQPITYRYRTWPIGAHKLVARTEIHASIKGDKKVNIYALNEYDSKLTGNVEFRQKLDNQLGAVMANELKNNAAKVAKWTAQSLMAGVDAMKLGFISRITPIDPTKHVILGINTVKPRDLALQINLNERNMWGIVKNVIDLVMSKEPGKYLLIRDPNKPNVKLYKVPMSTFEESEEEGEDEDEEEEEDEGVDFVRPPVVEEEADDDDDDFVS
jgi:translation initiation factor 3 subunit D